MTSDKRLQMAAEAGVRRALLGRRLVSEDFRALVAAVEARLLAVPNIARSAALWRVARAAAASVVRRAEVRDGDEG